MEKNLLKNNDPVIRVKINKDGATFELKEPEKINLIALNEIQNKYSLVNNDSNIIIYPEYNFIDSKSFFIENSFND